MQQKCKGSRGENTSIWNVTAPVRWGNPTPSEDPPGYIWSYAWSTTIFDLRPDLKSITGATKQGFPIWDTAARLYISLNGTLDSVPQLQFDGSNMTVLATNFIQILDANVQGGAGSVAGSSPSPNLIQTDTQDVSAAFFPPAASLAAGLGNSLAVFTRPGDAVSGGEGYPVRFWRVRFIFQYFVGSELPLPVNPTPPNPLVLTAGMY